MKIKQAAGDFVVEEIADLAPSSGPYGLYRLIKEHIGTLEAAAAIAREWGIRRRRISYCGLKDRHARAVQYITIRDGPDRGLERPHFRLEPLGRTDRPAGPDVLRANRFRITVRDLSEEEAAAFRDGLRALARAGIPNYFDAQRFGCSRDGSFAARDLIEGRFEDALRRVLAAPHPEDPARRRAVRETLARLWGRWKEAAAELPPSNERSIVTYLAAHPDRFDRAFELLEPSYRTLLMSAYQSLLWNRALAKLIRRHVPEVIERRIAHWMFPFPARLEDSDAERWGSRKVPLPAPKMSDADAEARAAVEEVLAEEGIEPRRMRIRRLRRTFFSRGERAAWMRPEEMEVDEPVADESNAGRRAVTFRCVLPKGCYATLIARRLLGTQKRGVRLD